MVEKLELTHKLFRTLLTTSHPLKHQMEAANLLSSNLVGVV